MDSTPQTKTIRDLVELFRNKMLTANPEYQRGVVWNKTQKKKLVDSVLRGYPLPMIYLHHIKRDVAGMVREDLEVVDGQQRINALYEFAEGAFSLFDPKVDQQEAKFPKFLAQESCPWGGKDIHGLTDELKKQFLDTPLAVTMLTTSNPHEVRDLFVRLQSGLPLNAQETRDAWPGQFTEFILALGGKPEIAKYPGHQFFKEIMGLRGTGDRGKARQFAAQIAMLFFNRRESGADSFSDIKSAALNDFYYSHVDFDKNSADAKRLVDILDRLTFILRSDERPKLKGHDAIHLVLLADSLWDDYTRSWEEKLPNALDHFMREFAEGKLASGSGNNESWRRYGQWTRVNSDRGETIASRHQFYVQRMLEFLAPLQMKDSKRLYGNLEREVVFFRSTKRCAVCSAVVPWSDAEIHHLEPHYNGGKTVLANAALVHSHCHPKSDVETKRLSQKINDMEAAEQSSVSQMDKLGYFWSSKEGHLFLPAGTQLKMTFKKDDYFALVEGSKVIFEGDEISPSVLANRIAGHSRNAWRDLLVRLPHQIDWVLAAEARQKHED